MTDLQKENVKRWIAALRSGDYMQGTGRLCRKNMFCELSGVS